MRIDADPRDFVARSIEFYRSDPSVHEVPGTTRVFERSNGRAFGLRSTQASIAQSLK